MPRHARRPCTQLLPGLALLGLSVVLGCEDPAEPGVPAANPNSPAVIQPTVAPAFTVTKLGTLGGGFSAAFGVNERTDVVGDATIATQEVRAFLWRRSRGMRSLGTLGGDESIANQVNDQTEVVGGSEVTPGSDVLHAFLWIPGSGMRDLGTLGGMSSVATGINNRREVVGVSDNPNGRPRAFLWRPSRGMRSLGTLGGSASEATDVNDATQVVGYSDVKPGGPAHAFLWTAARGMEDLGTLGGAQSIAWGISQTGEVVGESLTPEGTTEAFLWTRSQGMRGLGQLGGDLTDAFAVNTHLRVVGQALTRTGSRGFIWRPEVGMRRLPLAEGGINEAAQYLNEFGIIVGSTANVNSEFRAAIWTPTAGPLLASTETVQLQQAPASSLVPGGSPCAVRRRLSESTGFKVLASRACAAR